MALTNFTGLRTMRSALLCSALAVPTLGISSAHAQNQAEACMQLQQVGDQINFGESDVSEEEFVQVVESNDPQQCEAWLNQVSAQADRSASEVAETERARVRLEDEVVIEGRVIVDQQPPNVEVDEQPAEVTVGNVTPDIGINQEPIDILIRQAAPRISFNMPQPTVQIEQAAPEIIITMPDPSVEVGNMRPQVEVRQAEPQVRVTMPEPTVELDLYQAEDPETSQGIAVEQRQPQEGTDSAGAQPQVTMNRAEAQILYQETQQQQQANVTISRGEPTIRFEQADPELEITSSGEPQVNWSQTGEPTVTFQESAEREENGAAGQQDAAAPAGQQTQPEQTEAEQAQADQAQAGQAQTGQAQTEQAQTEQAQGGQTEPRGPNVRREGYEGVPADEILASELDGATVHGVQGNEVGEIGTLTLSANQPEVAIIDVGVVLGTDERRVEVPFSDLTFLRGEEDGDIRVYIDASEERLMEYEEADE
ncbi:MAG: PRC-barrel domain-containing protein [Rhodobacterales bacterium]